MKVWLAVNLPIHTARLKVRKMPDLVLKMQGKKNSILPVCYPIVFPVFDLCFEKHKITKTQLLLNSGAISTALLQMTV
tara:strand:- start:792 stop:1025 length:234 start_codon:yes stop_codon:yes gene_type:complete